MTKIEGEFFFIYWNDLKKKGRDELTKYLKDNGVDDWKEIKDNELPIIVIGTEDDDIPIGLDSMVS